MEPTLSAATHVGDAARSFQFATHVFDRFGIDYCCGGRLTIAEACARGGVDLDALLAALRQPDARAGDERDWSRAGITELCDHIEAEHHAFVRDSFRRIENLLPRILRAHAARVEWLPPLERTLGELKEELFDHMIREERVLFPWHRRLDDPRAVTLGPPWSVKRPIECMVHDHDGVGSMLERTREMTGGYASPVGACTSMRSLMRTLADLDRDTRVHIHKESNILFPAGVAAEERIRGAAPAMTDIRVH